MKDKTHEYSYLLPKQVIRMMKTYYKCQLEQFGKDYNYQARLKKITREKLNEIFKKFISIEFKNCTEAVEIISRDRLLTQLQIVILCHRSKRGFKCLKGLKFTDFSDLIDNYNYKQLLIFFAKEANAFIFLHFQNSMRERGKSLEAKDDHKPENSEQSSTKESKEPSLWSISVCRKVSNMPGLKRV